ncbi:SpoIIAA family protein [Pontibacter pudoricolor]|uniref:STAS/SEC14 domain-containing protein n=1 Tax=Pontibacter pudoricolor TaxID=2694930 RepID=UPI0013919C1D|nr:STAS/SEC14 domain-containing protein [Pontibacter pudoricolor]
MLELLEESKGDLVAFRISGHVDKNDYDIMLPILEEKIKMYGKINVYAEMQEVEDFTLKALWEDLKFDFRHASDFSKAALVGEQKWLDWLIVAASPFTSATVKHFTLEQRQQALDWIQTPEE